MNKNLAVIPGVFVAAGYDYFDGILEAWLEAFGYPRVPEDHKLPVPVQARVKEDQGQRDFPEVLRALQEGRKLGFETHVSIEDNAGLGIDQMDELKAWSDFYSYGNKAEKGANPPFGRANSVQDDAGVRSAVYNAAEYPGVVTAFHGYGEAGFDVGHITRLRKMFPEQEFRITELHYGFLKHGTTRKAKEYLYSAEAGAYCARMTNAAAANRMPVCLFRARDFFTEDFPHATGYTESMEVLRGNISYALPMVVPGVSALQLTVGMYWNYFTRPR